MREGLRGILGRGNRGREPGSTEEARQSQYGYCDRGRQLMTMTAMTTLMRSAEARPGDLGTLPSS